MWWPGDRIAGTRKLRISRCVLPPLSEVRSAVRTASTDRGCKVALVLMFTRNNQTCRCSLMLFFFCFYPPIAFRADALMANSSADGDAGNGSHNGNGAYSDSTAPSKFTKDQVEAIILYVGAAALIAVALALFICCSRRRKRAKLHATSAPDTRDVATDSSG